MRDIFKINIPTGYQKTALPGLTEWIAELSSGLPQTKSRLRSNDGYCCLGVLSKVQGRLKLSDMVYVDKHESQSGCLSRENPLTPYIGMHGQLPIDVSVSNGNSSAFYLTECNDELGMTLPEIGELLNMLYYPVPKNW